MYNWIRKMGRNQNQSFAEHVRHAALGAKKIVEKRERTFSIFSCITSCMSVFVIVKIAEHFVSVWEEYIVNRRCTIQLMLFQLYHHHRHKWQYNVWRSYILYHKNKRASLPRRVLCVFLSFPIHKSYRFGLKTMYESRRTIRLIHMCNIKNHHHHHHYGENSENLLA